MDFVTTSPERARGPFDWVGPDADAGAALAVRWVLTLDRLGPDGLLAVLTDSAWFSTAAVGRWPPLGGEALPPAVAQELRQHRVQQLRLQLPAALDDWPWEGELVTAGVTLAPRFVMVRGEADTAAPDPTVVPLVAVIGASGAHQGLVAAASRRERPMVLVDAGWSAARLMALESALRSRWRDGMLLSQALAQTLQGLALPAASCRLYGDGRAQVTEDEQGWRPVTAVSVDLVRSTRLLEELGAEAYAARLQAYHDCCRDVILNLKGSLSSPQGNDGFMAYFGFPMAVEDAATRALTAAWRMSCGVAALGLKVRVGVASGQVVVSARQAYAGEIHLAARLRDAALPGQVLVAPSTRDRVGQGFVLSEESRPLELRDFAHVRRVYSLEALAPEPQVSETGRGGVQGFVGRQQELHQLQRNWEEARAGRLQWCVVQGEAGIGKSRLLQEFSRWLCQSGFRCLVLSGQEQAARSPFAAMIDALRRFWGIDASWDMTDTRRRLAEWLPGGTLEAAADRDELAALLAPARTGAAALAAKGPRRWSELLAEALAAMLASAPLCLVVDDAHWLDPSSMELLRRLRLSSAQSACMVLLGERSGPGRGAAPPEGTCLDLPRLSPEEARELLASIAAELPESLSRHVIERADGVPLYLEESLRMLLRSDGEPVGDVPPKLEDLLMVRLDELGPDRALAQLMAVLGREFSAVHLESMLERDDPFVERARQQGSLRSLLSGGLLEAAEGVLPGYRFRHVLIRDAAYGSILAHDRRRLHGLFAELIEDVTPALAQQRPEHLAQHLEAAGRNEPALSAWMAAAQLSAARLAHPETRELAHRALALNAQRPEGAERAGVEMRMQLLLASAHIALQGYGSHEVETAYQAAERASRVLADTAHAVRIRLGLEACYVMRGDLPRAAALAQACVQDSAWDADARLAMQARWALANVKFHEGDWAAALAGFDDCLAHYEPGLHRRSGVQDPAVMCLGYASWILFERGRADEALRRIDRMLTLAETLAHPFSTGVALGFAASIKRLCGDVQGAWPHALEAVRVCERGGFQVWLAHAWMVRGQLRSDRGDRSGGDADMERGYRQWTEGGARISCATYLATRAEILLRQRRTTEAAQLLARANEVSEAIGEHHYHAELQRLQGLCAWQGGDAARAEAELTAAVALAATQQRPGLGLRCALSLGALRAALGAFEPAALRLRQALSEVSDHAACRDWRWAQQALASWEAGTVVEHEEHTPWEPR